MLYRICYGGLLLLLLGCSRSTVAVATVSDSRTEEPAAPASIAGGKDETPTATPFAFPEDAGGALLAKVLPPKAPGAAHLDRSNVSRRPASSRPMTPPTLTLPPIRAVIPRLPASVKPTPLRPRLVLDETPAGLPDAPMLPQSLTLPDGVRVRIPSVDVNRPLPLPILARPISDRAPLDDATAGASAAAALAAPMPPRNAKAAFLKLMRPDPYGRRRATGPAPEESKEFPLGSPRTPRPEG